MQTVNFSCGHCGNLMAVGTDYLGQQVRCPHCQEVVQTPRPADEPSPLQAVPPPDDPAGLFDGAETLDTDDLFDGKPRPRLSLWEEPPHLELVEGPPGFPPRPVVPLPPSAEKHAPSDTPSKQPSDWVETLDWEPPVKSEAHAPRETVRPEPEEAPPFRDDSAPLLSLAAATAGALGGNDEANLATLPPVRPVQHGRGGGMFLILVVIPLISYSVLATVAVLILYFRQIPPHPLEALPDFNGEFKGAERKKQGSVTYERVSPHAPLPAQLRVALRQTRRLGDLEVTATRVELRRLVFLRPEAEPETAPAPSLVLHLRVRNVSRDVVFAPTDPYFERYTEPGASTGNPYTFVTVDGKKYYGGPLAWEPEAPDEGRDRVQGQVFRRLGPGEEYATVVCTAPDEKLGKLLARHHGPLLWRVQLRRGLVPVGAREVSATAVVGVEFSKDTILKEPS